MWQTVTEDIKFIHFSALAQTRLWDFKGNLYERVPYSQGILMPKEDIFFSINTLIFRCSHLIKFHFAVRAFLWMTETGTR
jgi:hypothetical protein